MTTPRATKDPTDGRMIATNVETPGILFDRWWLLVAGIILMIVVLVLAQPDPFGRILQFVSDGILMTIFVTLVSFLLILVLGLIGGLGRLSRNTVINGLATLYVEVVRGIPLLVQLLFWYFAFPALIQSLGDSINYAPFINYRPSDIAMAILG